MENKLTTEQIKLIKKAKEDFILFETYGDSIINIRFTNDLLTRSVIDKFRVISTLNFD
tara:strand:+ start:1042 stop:1215 length:174 start_codon:yes stop_codon:yes gene_type:complete